MFLRRRMSRVCSLKTGGGTGVSSDPATVVKMMPLVEINSGVLFAEWSLLLAYMGTGHC